MYILTNSINSKINKQLKSLIKLKTKACQVNHIFAMANAIFLTIACQVVEHSFLGM